MKYLILSIFVFILSFLRISGPVEEGGAFLLSTLAVPFKISALQTQEAISFLINIREVYQENQNLKEQVLDLQSEKVALQEYRKENEILRSQFLGENYSIPPDGEERVMLVSLIGNPADLTNSTIYLNVGSKKGVKENTSVIYKNFLIGKVREVEKYRSLVDLLYSPDLSIPVKRVSKDVSLNVENDIEESLLSSTFNFQTEGIVTGDFGTSLKLNRVLQKEPLERGDILVTSGREGIFKPGYIVGRVGDIYAIPTEPLKSAQILPLIDIERLSYAFVVLEGEN
jgi:rod shape-determining protein MreC